ncbi:hypothetical protein AcW2_000485 [Taiwanofungus camphoratus]|nr:hypothetical protein AcW2_000485 [Antrodia cinnamomea]
MFKVSNEAIPRHVWQQLIRRNPEDALLSSLPLQPRCSLAWSSTESRNANTNVRDGTLLLTSEKSAPQKKDREALGVLLVEVLLASAARLVKTLTPPNARPLIVKPQLPRLLASPAATAAAFGQWHLAGVRVSGPASVGSALCLMSTRPTRRFSPFNVRRRMLS